MYRRDPDREAGEVDDQHQPALGSGLERQGPDGRQHQRREREQLVAFLLGALLLGTLWGLRILVPVLPSEFASVVDYACPATHFLDSAARGVLDLRDVIYFFLLVVFGLTSGGLVVEGRRWR